METVKFKTISGVIIALLLGVLVLMAVYTWHLSRELTALQANTIRNDIAQTALSSSAAMPDTTMQVDPKLPMPTPGQQRGQGSQNIQPPAIDPFTGLSDPFADDWPGLLSPGSSFAEMQRRMDELMSSMTRGFPFFSQNDFGFGFMSAGPVVAMTEDDQAYLVSIQIPEGQNVELETELSNKTLIISGSVKTEQEQAGVAGFNSRNMQESRFSQSMYLSEDIDEAAMTVVQNDDEILITIPKRYQDSGKPGGSYTE